MPRLRHPASRFALTGVFVAKTKVRRRPRRRDRRIANGVMRVPAIEAALKANWSAGRDRQRQGFRRRPDDGHSRLVGLPRQPDQGDGAARG